MNLSTTKEALKAILCRNVARPMQFGRRMRIDDYIFIPFGRAEPGGHCDMYGADEPRVFSSRVVMYAA